MLGFSASGTDTVVAAPATAAVAGRRSLRRRSIRQIIAHFGEYFFVADIAGQDKQNAPAIIFRWNAFNSRAKRLGGRRKFLPGMRPIGMPAGKMARVKASSERRTRVLRRGLKAPINSCLAL